MISKTAEYALRAVVFLAQSDQVPINRTEISAATQIPNPYLHKVLQELHQAGIVSVQRGPGGGYQLIIDPNDLTDGRQKLFGHIQLFWLCRRIADQCRYAPPHGRRGVWHCPDDRGFGAKGFLKEPDRRPCRDGQYDRHTSAK